MGRFLTRDKNTEVNLYAYCENNPVIRIDEDGEFWNLLIGAGAGALISGGVTMAVNISQGKAWHEGIGIAMASGAITGALAASGVGLSGQIIGNALIGGMGSGLSAISDIKKDKSKRLTSRENLSKIASNITTGAVIGAVSGYIGGAGTGTRHLSSARKGLIKSVTKAGKPFKKALKYYMSQIAKVSVRSGKKSLLPIAKAGIPALAYGLWYGYKK